MSLCFTNERNKYETMSAVTNYLRFFADPIETPLIVSRLVLFGRPTEYKARYIGCNALKTSSPSTRSNDLKTRPPLILSNDLLTHN